MSKSPRQMKRLLISEQPLNKMDEKVQMRGMRTGLGLIFNNLFALFADKWVDFQEYRKNGS
jgi:hypothetical protein